MAATSFLFYKGSGGPGEGAGVAALYPLPPPPPPPPTYLAGLDPALKGVYYCES